MQKQKRKVLIYDNCKVLNPNGDLMFRCLKKKINWYLKRNLAVVIDNDPLTIQLNFVPKGKGELNESLLHVRENKCVVCGDIKLENLTKHHLIPYEFRKHFPIKMKEHNSSFIVPLCEECHRIYEKMASKRKLEISEQFNIGKTFKEERRQVKGMIKYLIKNRESIPEEGIVNLKNKIKKYLSIFDIKLTDDDFNSDEKIRSYLSLLPIKEEAFGEEVVKRCNDIEEFSNSWVKHFIETMHPLFIPSVLNEISQKVL
jgi:hypothetical protein